MFTNIRKEKRIGLMIHRNRMGWWWLTIPFVSSNCPPLVNVIIVAKVTRHYWVDSDSSRSLSLSLSLHTHTHTQSCTVDSRRRYPTCELVRWIRRAYLWAMEETVDFLEMTHTLHLQCLCRRQLTACSKIFPLLLRLVVCVKCYRHDSLRIG